MTFSTEPLLVSGYFAEDSRGTFSKPYMAGVGRDFEAKELYWTRSAKGTIRGLHFQLPPHEIAKLIWVSRGAVFDVLVDIRAGESYGKLHGFTLDATSGQALYVPAGFAHGYQALEEASIVNYAVNGVFAPEHDKGVRWNSAGIDWPLEATKVSEKDRGQPLLADFETPFSRA